MLTFSGFTRSVGSNWTTHQLIGGKAKAEHTSAKLQTVSMSIKFSTAFGICPRPMLERLTKMAEGREVFPLTIGGKPVGHNSWRLTSVSESWGVILNKGELVEASVNITLEEYV